LILPHATPCPPPSILQRLPKEHLLRDLIDEHARLLAYLDELDELIEAYRDAAGTPEARDIAARIRVIAETLVHAEPHHRREEEVLFPELEKRGVATPSRIMRREHEALRAWKRKLLDAASVPHPDTEAVAEPAGSLAASLREHILKENEVLYPMALSTIADDETWQRMRSAAAKLGPCCVSCGCSGAT
jgi:DUF438 domain-containing protein